MRTAHSYIAKLSCANLNIFVQSKGNRVYVFGYAFVFYDGCNIIFHTYLLILPITPERSRCIAIQAARAAS